MDRHSQNILHRGRSVQPKDVAVASDYFEHFLNATSLKNILGYYRSICDHLNLKPNVFPLFYPKLKGHLTSWRAKALWKKFDARAGHKCYGKGKLCANNRVLIIGAGPCGLRTAIEAQLLGAKVVVIEKRDRLSRNNVLHLWPFVIDDLRALGAKKFFGKFCAGAIDHISIRQIQCILLKVALLLGVEVHTEVSFQRLIEPDINDKTGWRAEFVPANHPVSQYEFETIIGADGKRNTLQGFTRKEFRGKLAIAITANFINKRTEAEARVEEISGVAFIFNQKFFKELHEATGIDLENIVYYKDDTHYFVMTAKKASLIEKGVIKQDLADTERLLAMDNVNREALMDYAREAANFSTNYQMPDVEFAVNHYGQADVAMFDFTSMYAAENASKVVERNGYRLLMILVGDSLLEPFWPTGSGCARGFLSSLDAAWAIRAWSSGTMTPLEVLAERESIYRLLAQTTPDNLNKDYKSYTLDPATRYPNLNKTVVMPHQTVPLYDTDNPKSVERMRRNSQDAAHIEVPKKRRRGNVDNEVLLNWISEQIRNYEDIVITDIASVFRDGKALCAILTHYRPDLLDYNAVKDGEPAKNNQLAIDLLEKEIGISPVMTGEEITDTDDYLTMAAYLTQIYDNFRCEIPHIKHPKLELPEPKRNEVMTRSIKLTPPVHITPPINVVQPPSRPLSRHKRHADAMTSNKPNSVDRKTRKRRTLERIGASVEERQKIWQEIVANRSDRQNKRRHQRKLQTEQFIKSMQMLQANAKADSQPFEDYSIFLYRQTAQNFEDRVKDLEKKFTYVPDHDNKLPNQTRGNADEDFAARIKNMEDRWKEPQPVDKKPKDLLRAIGKIETSDWNIKEIEKKIRENKLGKAQSNKDKEKVPKWSKEQFLARQTKMEKQHLDRQDSTEAKFADIDKNIKHLELKLKEGTVRDLGQNKVATITEKLSGKVPDTPELKPLQKSQSRPAVVLPSGSEFCHFCGKRVYLMERLSAEGRFFHHGCFKCQYCNTQLRLGSYAFDKDGFYDHKFFCIHHYGMQGEPKVTKVQRKPSHRQMAKSPEKKPLSGIAGVDLLDRVRTPERIEFSNLSVANASSDHEESLSQMDEDEWTDKNFGQSAAELDSNEESSSSLSDTDSDDEDAYEEALEEPATKEGTLKWAERFNKRYSKKRNASESDDYSSSDQSSYYENTSDDEDSDTATEGEEEIRARELRKQEVRVEPPVVQTDTGTDTEIVSDESSDSSSEIPNSATEISTDSEFAHDDPTPTREIPSIVFNDFHVTKHRGGGGPPRRIQVTSGYLQKPANNGKTPKTPTTTTTNTNTTKATTNVTATTKRDIELKLTPLVPSAPSIIRKNAPSLLPRTEGYALNRTQSTGGIAAKVSLELKKKYLLGESNGPGSIQKSGSASTLDTKLKSFHTNITDCQKMLKPASDVNAGTVGNKINEGASPAVTPQSPVIYDAPEENAKSDDKPVFENELEGRPRSPVHETSIIVPKIDWNKSRGGSNSEDSLSDESSADEPKVPDFNFDSIPTVRIDEFPPDSLCVVEQEIKPADSICTSEPPKSIASERKMLNQPKQLPDLEINVLPDIHNALHVKKQSPEGDQKSSGRSTPSEGDSVAEQATAALTETELSDWARDGIVSDDLEDVDFELTQEPIGNARSNRKAKVVDSGGNLGKIAHLDNLGHVCGKEELNKTIITEATNSMLSKNLDHIEFMDTGTETSSDDGIVNSQNGYVLFKDEDDLAEDSLNPNINDIVEARNDQMDFVRRNTGYCLIGNESNNYGSEVIDLKATDVEKLKNKQTGDHDEDSLLIVDTGTTTEENTCSDSTVKNVTEITADKVISQKVSPVDNNNFQRKRLEDKLAKLKAEQALAKQEQLQKQQQASQPPPEIISSHNSIEFDEHCQRLQSKIEFGNAKDSIDIRKSRRKSKSESPQKPDLIQEENSSPVMTPKKDITLKLAPTVRTPDVLYKKEVIEKERDDNQKLIQEMVMLKMKAENKSLERKKRRGYPSLNRPFELTKSATTDIVSEINKNNIDLNNSIRNSTYTSGSSTYATPDVLLSTLKKSPSITAVPDNDIFSTPMTSMRPYSAYARLDEKARDENKENASLSGDFKTPLAPPRLKHEEAKRTAEKLRQDARVRARLLSNEELGLSPEDKLFKLREKLMKRPDDTVDTVVMKTERPNSWLYSNDTLSRKKNGSLRRTKSGDENPAPCRTKSISEIADSGKIQAVPIEDKQIFKSDPNLLDTNCKKSKKKSKDRERRKSITKMITTFFRKSPSGPSKGIFSKISPKTKDVSKSCANLDLRDPDVVVEEPTRRKSFSETTRRSFIENSSPPPIPPLPLHYTGASITGIDDSSDGEHDWKRTDRSSCDTLDQSGIVESTASNLSTKRANKGARKAARQAQLKRHRMAQEIQRKLEETEVKTRELEERGVTVEKALRGEDSARYSKDESELLQEWFDLMRDRTELRRYERELMVRAQELELEDRHARLQHELRERLENNEHKTQNDVEIEGSIINEMMEIVAKRDSLIALLEEDRLRYSNEDRDFEEQMLAKGLRLTSVRKTPEK